jgi:SAM-dependent methyltransferase
VVETEVNHVYMAEFNDVYRLAQYYDIVFQRDVVPEVRYIVDWYTQQHHRPPQSLLDLACGPGYHARVAAQLGLHAIGLDLRPEMLQLAQDYALADGVQVTWIADDMRYLQLAEPVDIILNVFDGIDCLLTNDDLIAHFQAMAHCLTEGGVYLIDIAHPRFTTFNYYEKWSYRGMRDNVDVQINWAVNSPLVDPVTSVSNTQVEMIVNDHGTEYRYLDNAHERILSAQEIDLLARLSGGLRPVGWYGGYDLSKPLGTTPDAERMVVLLQKL